MAGYQAFTSAFIMPMLSSLLLSLLTLPCALVAQIVVPDGAMLPSSLHKPFPNQNSFKPNRPTDNAPINSASDQSHTSGFKTYHFAATLFLIILGSIFVVAGIIVGILVLLRWMRNSDSRLKEEERRFELEQEGLTQRTATISRRHTNKTVQSS